MDKNEKIIDELLSKMTLAEKIGQLNQVPSPLVDDEKLFEDIRKGKIGSLIMAQTPQAGNDGAEIAYEELLNTPFENCFTKVAVKTYPQVQELLNLLSQFGQSYMSGSGSSCFVAFDTKEEAQNAKLILDKKNIASFVARSVSLSPTLVDLEQLKK